MGEVRRKAKRDEVLKRERKNKRMRKLRYAGSIPVRLIKAATGFIFCIFVVPVHAAYLCFKRNIWIWDEYNA